MPDATSVTQILSDFPQLSSLAETTLAINLAYLNLQRFRYREQIRQRASSELDALGSESVLPKSILESDQFKEILYLARLKNNDGLDDTKNHKKIFAASPSGGWAFLYRFIFANHQDLGAAIMLSIFSTLILLAGTAEGIHAAPYFTKYATDGWALFYFVVLSMGLLFPMIFVLSGRRVVRKGCNHAVKAGKQLAALLADMAGKVEAPETNGK